MARDIDICNLALSHLGDEAEVTSIAGSDTSTQAVHCRRFYPIARDALLEAHPWPFAVKRDALTAVTNTLGSDWAYAYELPDDCLRPLASLHPGMPERLLSNEGTDASSHPYIVEMDANDDQILYTNVQTSTLRYICQNTDTATYSPGFVVSLSRLLASFLAGPILKGDSGRKESVAQLKIFEMEFRSAAARTSNVGKRDAYQTRQPSFIAARGGLLRDDRAFTPPAA